MPPRSRRALLAAAGSGIGLLAGCQTGTVTETPDGTPTGTETSTRSPSPSPHPLLCGPVDRPAGWPLGDGSAARDSYAAGWPGFDGAPSVAWTATPTKPHDDHGDPLFTQPVAVGDRVYTVAVIQYGTMQDDPGGHTLQARDAADGDRVWRYELPRLPSEAALWGDSVLVVSRGTLHAVDRRDGSGRWTRTFPAGVLSVVPAGDRAFVRLVPSDADAGVVHALAPGGGTDWQVAPDGGLQAGPTVGPGHVLLATGDGRLLALDRSTGTTEWTARLREGATEGGVGPPVSTIVATDCGVFGVVGGAVHAFDEEGAPVWTADDYYDELATDGRTLFAPTDRLEPDDRSLRALDAATGEVRWERSEEVARYEPPVVTDGAVYAPGVGEVLAVDPADGAERWRSTDVAGSLAFAEETLYGIDDGRLVALRDRRDT